MQRQLQFQVEYDLNKVIDQSHSDKWKSMGTWEKDQEETLEIVRDKLGMYTFEGEEVLKVEKLF